MRFDKYLSERRSVREYKDKKVSSDKLNRLMDFVKEIEKAHGNSNIRFVLFQDGKRIYENLNGLAGYAGVMINSPHYIGLKVLNEDNETFVRGSYAMESLITKAYQLDLGTCWVNINNIPKEKKVELLGDEAKDINYMLSIGYAKDKGLFEEEPTSSRLSIEDIVYLEKWGNNANIEELESRGLKDLFYYVRFAPSDKNSQPWRFILKNNVVLLTILNPLNKTNLTDAGIIMYYFERMVSDIGIRGEWKFYKENSGKEEVYSIIAEFKI